MEAEATIEPASRKPFPKKAKEGDVGFVEMTKSCARDLTDRIKTAGEQFAVMLYRAHEERAWAALGYASWKEYCQAEFQMSKTRSYQLLDFVEIKREIQKSTIVDSPQNESQTRALKVVPTNKRVEVWEAAKENTPAGEEPKAKEIKAVALEVLEPEPKSDSRSPRQIERDRRDAARTRKAGEDLKRAWWLATEDQKKRIISDALKSARLERWIRDELDKISEERKASMAAFEAVNSRNAE
jgi:hypothetical protein